MSNSILKEMADLYPKSKGSPKREKTTDSNLQNKSIKTREETLYTKKYSNANKWKIALIIALITSLITLIVYMLSPANKGEDNQKSMDKVCIFMAIQTIAVLFIGRALLEVFLN